MNCQMVRWFSHLNPISSRLVYHLKHDGNETKNLYKLHENCTVFGQSTELTCGIQIVVGDTNDKCDTIDGKVLSLRVRRKIERNAGSRFSSPRNFRQLIDAFSCAAYISTGKCVCSVCNEKNSVSVFFYAESTDIRSLYYSDALNACRNSFDFQSIFWFHYDTMKTENHN